MKGHRSGPVNWFKRTPGIIVLCFLITMVLASLSPADAAPASDQALSPYQGQSANNSSVTLDLHAAKRKGQPPTPTLAPTNTPPPILTATPVPTSTAVATSTSAPTVSPTSPPIAQTGLVAAYAFNEGSGSTITDLSGNGNSGSITGASWTYQGRFGNALSFNGSNSFVKVNSSDSLNLGADLTLEAWVYPTALGGWRNVLLKEQSGDLTYGLYANTDSQRPAGYIYVGGEVDTRGNSQLPLNSWTHLAVTHDGTYLNLYVNGSLASTKTIAGSTPASAGPVEIGGDDLWGEYFSGSIDEVRIYDRALSQTEIQTDMNTALDETSQLPTPTSAVTSTPAAEEPTST
ncbi:MAG TPA: LamG-like jellyroll fold domain-containing protein, partial [Chloroflexota bacterium]|nr:LamG-like jellyroll fold domain-containing protein [Chloroflexota bacterium]